MWELAKNIKGINNNLSVSLGGSSIILKKQRQISFARQAIRKHE